MVYEHNFCPYDEWRYDWGCTTIYKKNYMNITGIDSHVCELHILYTCSSRCMQVLTGAAHPGLQQISSTKATAVDLHMIWN